MYTSYRNKNDHKWSFFLYNLYIFVWIQQKCIHHIETKMTINGHFFLYNLYIFVLDTTKMY